MSSTYKELKQRSDEIREKYCDKEKIFYKFEGTIGQRKDGGGPNRRPREQIRRHDVVRQ